VIYNSLILIMSQLSYQLIPYVQHSNGFSMPCAHCRKFPAGVSYYKFDAHNCTSCCFAPLCQRCDKLHSVTCFFCPGQRPYARSIYKNHLGGTTGWMRFYADMLKCSEALKLMPCFLIFLRSCPVKIGWWEDVNTRKTYEMYVAFMEQMRTKMGLHLWHGFWRFSFPSIRVIERNVGAFDAMTKQFFLSNQDPLCPWKPTRRQVCQFRFGLISTIASKMAIGSFQVRLTDKSTREIIRILLMRILSFSG